MEFAIWAADVQLLLHTVRPAGMEDKVPLNERRMDNARVPDNDERWKKAPDVKTRPIAPRGHGAAPPRPLAAISTKKVGGGYGKRGRDSQATGHTRGSRGLSPAHTKKSRGMGGGSDRKKPVAVPKISSDSRPDNRGERQPGQSRPKCDRRVGGIAPNGNPQCWIAPNESESDPHRVAQRMKQIEYGKNSLGYKAYLEAIPKCVFPFLPCFI